MVGVATDASDGQVLSNVVRRVPGGFNRELFCCVRQIAEEVDASQRTWEEIIYYSLSVKKQLNVILRAFLAILGAELHQYLINMMWSPMDVPTREVSVNCLL